MEDDVRHRRHFEVGQFELHGFSSSTKRKLGLQYTLNKDSVFCHWLEILIFLWKWSTSLSVGGRQLSFVPLPPKIFQQNFELSVYKIRKQKLNSESMPCSQTFTFLRRKSIQKALGKEPEKVHFCHQKYISKQKKSQKWTEMLQKNLRWNADD